MVALRDMDNAVEMLEAPHAYKGAVVSLSLLKALIIQSGAEYAVPFSSYTVLCRHDAYEMERLFRVGISLDALELGRGVDVDSHGEVIPPMRFEGRAYFGLCPCSKEELHMVKSLRIIPLDTFVDSYRGLLKGSPRPPMRDYVLGDVGGYQKALREMWGVR